MPGVREGEHGGDVARRVLLKDLVDLVAGLWLRVESELHQLTELGGDLYFAPCDWFLLDLSVDSGDEADRNIKQVLWPLQEQYPIVGHNQEPVELICSHQHQALFSRQQILAFEQREVYSFDTKLFG